MAALATLICAPAGADAATVSSISMYSDPGDFVGQGAHRVYHAGNDASQHDGVLTAGADGGTRGDSFSFRFRARTGSCRGRASTWAPSGSASSGRVTRRWTSRE